MFKSKENRIWEVFKILLYKMPVYPTNIKEGDVIKLYQMATNIFETSKNLEEIYMITGKIDDNIIKGEEIENTQ